jgi:hypothetical protein
MKKALFGPDGFQPGTTIEFAHLGRPLNYAPPNEKDPCLGIMIGGIPAGYKPKHQPVRGAPEVVIGP